MFSKYNIAIVYIHVIDTSIHFVICKVILTYKRLNSILKKEIKKEQ
jgi:hypothetical protein